MGTLLQDIRYALRGLTKEPGFAAAAVLTLGLGIGANTAVFSVVDGVLLKPLPYPEPGRLVSVAETNLARGRTAVTVSPANYVDWRDQSTAFDGLAAYGAGTSTLAHGGVARRVKVLESTAELFHVLGTVPSLGRVFRPEEMVRGAGRVVVLGHALHRERFGGDPGILGRPISIDGVPYEVIGVLPPGFRFPLEGSDLYLPFVFPKDVARQRGAHYLNVVGRLRPGVTLPEARRQLSAIGARLAAAYPGTNRDYGVSTEPLRDRIVGPVRGALLVLLGAVALVTLIACVNVASLFLARAPSREGEIAVRIALGASRARLVRQLLTESLLVALLGGGLAILFGFAGVEALRGLGPADLPRLTEVTLDGRVFLFTGLLAIVTSLLFGLAPALRASRFEVSEALKRRERGAGRGEPRLRALLVVGEIAVTLTLLTGAGLLAKSLGVLLRVDPGLVTRNVLTFTVGLPEGRYPDGGSQTSFQARLLARLDSLPGVRAAGAVNGLPLTGFGFSSSFRVEGAPVAPEDEPSGQVRLVSGRYFEALGIPLRSGRDFASTDRRGSAPVVLASERAVRLFWPDGNVLGRRLRFGASPGAEKLGGEIVGVVGDVHDGGLDSEAPPLFYVAAGQTGTPEMRFVVRTSVPPLTLADAVKREVAALDPGIPVEDVRTLDEVLSRSVSQPRFYALLLGAFATLALALSSVGLYGIVAYGVTRRTREIGIRLAVGAGPGDVVGLVIREGAWLLAAGLAAGLALSLGATRLLTSLLFRVSPTDVSSFLAVAALLASVALAACALPARRATRVDPIAALRSE